MPLVDGAIRFGAVCAVGLDETLFARVGPFPAAVVTQIVDMQVFSATPFSRF